MGQNLGCAPLRNGLLGYLTTIINLEIILKQLPGAVSLKTPGKQKYLSLASIRAVLFLTILTTDADDTEKAHCVSLYKEKILFGTYLRVYKSTANGLLFLQSTVHLPLYIFFRRQYDVVEVPWIQGQKT